MQLQDLQALKEIPGYTAILKAVLKSQIQLLVEQLCDQTGEESIILTASISDGTLCHLGSNRGKNFLDGREELKSEFLNHCLKVEEPQPKRLTRRHQPSPAKKKPATVTSPTFTSEFQEKLFSSRVHLNPISDAGTKAENTVFKLNIPGDDLETVHVSLNDDDDDDNDTDNYLDSFEQSENSSHDVKSKRSKRKHHKGGRKCALEKKRKSNENEAEMFDGSQIKTENIKDEEQDLEITGFEMGGNSKWTAGLGNSSLAVDAESDKGEGSNQSAMNNDESSVDTTKRHSEEDQVSFEKELCVKLDRESISSTDASQTKMLILKSTDEHPKKNMSSSKINETEDALDKDNGINATNKISEVEIDESEDPLDKDNGIHAADNKISDVEINETGDALDKDARKNAADKTFDVKINETGDPLNVANGTKFKPNRNSCTCDYCGRVFNRRSNLVEREYSAFEVASVCLSPVQ